MPGDAFELAGGVDELRDLRVRLVKLLELRPLFERLLDRHRSE
jgi:hypothetical protein